MTPKLVSLHKPHSAAAQSYQQLRMTVEHKGKSKNSVVIAIASPTDGDGKTLTAINLAGALAQNASSKVLLIDLDLRSKRDTLTDQLNKSGPDTAGISGVTKSDAQPWTDMIRLIPEFNLHLLPAGTHSSQPYEVLNSPELEKLITEARENYNYIIVDTAATTQYPDTQLIARWVDHFIVLVAAGRTTKQQLEECLNLMAPDKVMGLLLNDATVGVGGSHGR